MFRKGFTGSRAIVSLLVILVAAILIGCGPREIEATATIKPSVFASATPQPTQTPRMTSTPLPPPTATPQMNLWRVVEVHKCVDIYAKNECVETQSINEVDPVPRSWVMFENTQTLATSPAHCLNQKAQMPEVDDIFEMDEVSAILHPQNDPESEIQHFDMLTEKELEQLEL